MAVVAAAGGGTGGKRGPVSPLAEGVELRVALGPGAVRALRRVMAVTGWSADEVVSRALPRFAFDCDRAEVYRIEAR